MYIDRSSKRILICQKGLISGCATVNFARQDFIALGTRACETAHKVEGSAAEAGLAVDVPAMGIFCLAAVVRTIGIKRGDA